MSVPYISLLLSACVFASTLAKTVLVKEDNLEDLVMILGWSVGLIGAIFLMIIAVVIVWYFAYARKHKKGELQESLVPGVYKGVYVGAAYA